MVKPILAITMGDPAGVGPEVILKSWGDRESLDGSRRFIIGRAAVLARAAKWVGFSGTIATIDSPAEAGDADDVIPVLEIERTDADDAPPALLSAAAGNAAREAILLGADLALSKQIQALVTAPINKAALDLAGHAITGHTELLAERCGAPQVAMMLYLPPGQGQYRNPAGLGVVHVTLHVALRDVFDMLTAERIVNRCQLAHEFFTRVLAARGSDRPPRIGVAALNPHGGEGGLFGREEIDVIAPAVAQAQQAGIAAVGPLPCDTLMHRAAGDEFDAVVAMYHDQGHIALKLLGLHAAVNVTLGLPIIRTSVAHGTAFDRVGTGTANGSSMVQAVRTAIALAGGSH